MADARLRVHESERSRVFLLEKPVFTIGRRSAADLPCPPTSTDISREHAEIVRTGDHYILRDRQSRAGTFVNGQRVTEHTLVHGDRIRLGDSGALEIVFETGDTSISGLTQIPSDVADFRHLAAVLDGLRALGSGRVLEEVLALVVDSALDVTKAHRGFVMLPDDGGELECRVARGQDRRGLPGNSLMSGKIPRDVFRTGRSQLVDDLAGDSDHDHTVAIGIRQVMCVPLRMMPIGGGPQPPSDSGRVIGVLYLDGPKRAQRRSSSTLSALEAFATQAALAIESARLYGEAEEKARIDRDLRMAAEIQRSLLPAPTYVTPTCEIAAASLPCRTIGGDFYDYLERADGAFAFALGDVSGKGAPAALLAAAAQSHFAAQVTVGTDPAQIVARINTALRRRMIDARFVTLFHGVLTPDGRLCYCNAGQEPPVVVSGAEVAWLEEGGPILGLFVDASYASATVQLKRHDLVVVYSDGVTDALNAAGEEFGRARLLAALGYGNDVSAEAVVSGVMNAVRTFSQGARQVDDISVLALRYRGAPAEESRGSAARA